MSESPVKKGRGRPAAKAKEVEVVEKSPPTKSPKKVEKSPKKVEKEVVEEEDDEDVADEEVAPKRGRGRPPKRGGPATKAAPKAKKGRGRPAKKGFQGKAAAKDDDSGDESPEAVDDSE